MQVLCISAKKDLHVNAIIEDAPLCYVKKSFHYIGESRLFYFFVPANVAADAADAMRGNVKESKNRKFMYNIYFILGILQ